MMGRPTGALALACLLAGLLAGAPGAGAKPTAPVILQLTVLAGGQAGERAKLRLEAFPQVEGGRLDLDLALPEGLELVAGATSESDPGGRQRRVIECEVEVPAQGVFRVIGKAVLRYPEGATFARARILDLPVGMNAKPDPELPTRAVENGTIIEIPGEAGP